MTDNNRVCLLRQNQPVVHEVWMNKMKLLIISLVNMATLPTYVTAASIHLNEDPDEYREPMISDIYKPMEFDTALDDSLTIPSFSSF
ncbi:hypothetical protein SARC_05853 [Sphaeroforma arctica JP610]|uniref:Uncharacterized protein n=1 Tax=Sphaeroforma arctica JP610 TaxID=667725 RepID=A0A0L0G0W5_9EUKA|nr:hypothetical protein SARC_05853 [Sphaeroforma arctica JP610]KNC81848.1 hypothetical protein SARC_05853 [Sphaeroforma arctica JP610]|eukprot:XP_014155750.1 hypothetical protein SARC_05853 [Sphaeroforma arctica JP610]